MSDLINRQAVIDALHTWFRDGFDEDKWWNSTHVLAAIEGLPSAQPEINCSEFPNNSNTISRQDAVSRRRLLSDLKELITAWEKYPVMAEQIKGVEAAIGYVELIPSAQPERKKGRWIERNPQNSDKCRLIECDKCGFSHIVGFNVPYEHWIENRNFCERCGADMRGDEDDQR